MDNKNIDVIVAKYMKIWIWSILFGANSTLTYALSNSFVRDSWGILALGIAAIAMYGVMLTFVSWKQLIGFFKHAIIPSLFQNREQNFSETELKEHSLYLERAFYYMVYATMVIFLTKVSEILLTVLNKYD